MLPALELFYIWNIYGNGAGKAALLRPLLERIERKQEKLRGEEGFFLCCLLKGVCLRALNQLEQAANCFTEIIDNQENILDSDYLPPHAAFELGAFRLS